MSASGRWRILGATIMLVIAVAGVGLYLNSNTPPGTIIGQYSGTQTSVSTEIRPQRITSASETIGTTTSTTISWPPTLWINVSSPQPANYYLRLLESSGTESCVSLARELRKLPDVTNATAVAQIAYLALNATISSRSSGPEAMEAFELMLKGGTPISYDFGYPVPKYNTELQVLYWLATSTQFKRDDTLALAVAMSNGFWLTVGDDQVREAVRKDTISLLTFLRETGTLQTREGYFRLEDLPLEAKVALGWTGEESMRHGYGPPIGLIYWTKQQLPLYIYEADTVSIATLVEMRAEALRNGWVKQGSDVESLVSSVEDYLFFPTGPHFNYRTDYDKIVNDQGVIAVHDVDWQWSQHRRGLKFQGDCGTEMTIADAWLKSWGVATISEWAYTLFTQYGMKKFSHSFVIYYEPTSMTWKAYSKQISEMAHWITQMGGNSSQPFDMFICRPPVIQQDYLREKYFESRTIKGVYYASYWHFQGNMYYQIELAPWTQLADMLSRGIPTATMKEWFFYSEPAI